MTRLTLFPNFYATTKSERELAHNELLDLLRKPKAPKKESLPLLSLMQFGKLPTTQNSLRHNGNVFACWGCAGDYDGERLAPEEAVERLNRAGVEALIYTSPSHRPEAPRWRVLCQYAEPLAPTDHVKMINRLNGALNPTGRDSVLAGESWTLSQSFFYGQVSGGHPVEIYESEGQALDLLDDLDEIAIGKPGAPRSDGTTGTTTGDPLSEEDALAQIRSGEHYFRPSISLAGRWAFAGIGLPEARDRLYAAFDEVFPAERDEKWQKARSSVLRWLQSMYGKEAKQQHQHHEQREQAEADFDARSPGDPGAAPPPRSDDETAYWPEPVDCFTPFNIAPEDVEEADAPPALWPFINDTAERMGVARSTVTLGCLVTCSAVADDEYYLQPKQYDDTWTEQARIWGAIVGDPSILKTPVIQATTRPLERLEREARIQWEDAVAKWEAAQKAAEAAHLDFDQPKPRRPRYLVESATIEAMQEVLRDDKDARFTAPAHKVLVRQDELSEFLANLDRYSNTTKAGGDRGAYLRLYNGGSYSVDRINRGSFTSSSWSGCLLGGIQPEPIQRVAKHAVDDGLLQRICFDVPAGDQDGEDRPPDRHAIERYHRLIPALAELHPHRKGLTITLALDAQPHRHDVANVARGLAATMPDMSARLKSTLGKWPGLFARLCLLFHLIEIADATAACRPAPPINVVSAATTERVARYMRRILLPHLLRADELMFATTQTGHAKWVAGHILAHKLDRISIRDVSRAYGALRAPEQRRELESVMESLVAIGWLDPDPPKNPLTPILSWRVNPSVHTLFAERAERERREREARRLAAIAARTAGAAAREAAN